MFALIETNNATHIAIHIPTLGADKTLPAIAAMLEHNAVFIRKGWNDAGIVKAGMSIVLGNSYTVEGMEQDIAIATAGEVIGEDFVPATPEVLVSNKKSSEKKDAEIQRLRNELAATKDTLTGLRERITQLEQDEAENT